MKVIAQMNYQKYHFEFITGKKMTAAIFPGLRVVTSIPFSEAPLFQLPLAFRLDSP